MARLVIFDNQVKAVELPDRQVMIGRSLKNDIPLSDGLLSRKHCSIVPVAGGYRLLDLKSSNGTYLNGEKIEKVDLASDDIIEIGQSVIVFMEDGVWSRGEALARLRNPIKAQELIGRIKRHARPGGQDQKIPLRRIEDQAPEAAAAPSRGRRPRKSRAAGPRDPLRRPGVRESLEDFIAHRAMIHLLKGSASIRKLVSEVLAEVLEQDSGSGDVPVGDLKARIRASLRSRLDTAEVQRVPTAGPSEAVRGKPPAEEPGDGRAT
jgi:pSer/pThr/pTyr-binding forkhead associated (FHA) protein